MLAPLLPADTQEAFASIPNFLVENRSLALERFSNPANKEQDRKDVLTKAFKIPVPAAKFESWKNFLLTGIGLENILFGRLESRLMVNMAGGVMENAGICLDRLSGIPYLPGSAIKGCARNAALTVLKEAADSEKSALLVQIARVFGWSDQEWKEGRRTAKKTGQIPEYYSDFAFACGDAAWPGIRRSAALELAKTASIRIKNETAPWKDLGAFAGTVQFLPAFPWSTPNANLELEILTSHHSKYYQGEKTVATDDEAPIPVVFPAISAGHVFAFPMVGKDPELTASAREWLKTGIELFGLGAKTGAGYGWFSDVSQETCDKQIADEEKRKEEARKAKEDQARKAQQEADLLQRQQAAEAMKTMSPEEQESYKLKGLSEDRFRDKLQKFNQLEDPEKGAIVRALLETRTPMWEWIKAQILKKKKPWTQIEPEIRRIAKQLKIGKLP